MVVDRLGGDELLRADLGVGVPGADQREDLALAPGQAERMLARGGALADRDRADVQPTQRTTDDAGRGGAEILADVQGLAKAGSSAASSMARRVVRAADLVPQLGRVAPVAIEL